MRRNGARCAEGGRSARAPSSTQAAARLPRHRMRLGSTAVVAIIQTLVGQQQCDDLWRLRDRFAPDRRVRPDIPCPSGFPRKTCRRPQVRCRVSSPRPCPKTARGRRAGQSELRLPSSYWKIAAVRPAVQFGSWSRNTLRALGRRSGPIPLSIWRAGQATSPPLEVNGAHRCRLHPRPGTSW